MTEDLIEVLDLIQTKIYQLYAILMSSANPEAFFEVACKLISAAITQFSKTHLQRSSENPIRLSRIPIDLVRFTFRASTKTISESENRIIQHDYLESWNCVILAGIRKFSFAIFLLASNFQSPNCYCIITSFSPHSILLAPLGSSRIMQRNIAI